MPVRAWRRLASRFRSFIDADETQINAAAEVARRLSKSIPAATPTQKPMRNRQRAGAYRHAATLAARLGLKVNAGHGLTYHNVKAIAALPEMHELNIGHAIIGRAVMTGLKEAVAEMKRLMLEARG
ncbi:pyridoxine 5'-phosphate synthase [Salmonella enterica subsp. enterica]|nr:pyridoxine 5'-phosphate synthase [Salmonella enterica subsp. enterica]